MLATALTGSQKQLTQAEQSAWNVIRSSTVMVMDGTVPRGVAACINEEGYFIAHRSAVRFPLLFAQTSAGANVELEVISVDEPTQLALLVLKQKGVAAGFKPVRAMVEDKRAGVSLLAVLTSGPVRAELVSKERVGIINPTRRMFTLSEIRFEASQQRIAGALVFTSDAELVGVVGATLSDNEVINQDNAIGNAFGGGGGGTGVNVKGVSINQYGPGELTVAYSVAPNILERVIEGFLSPSHKPAHPAIGIVCNNAKDAGAQITEVTRGSVAEAGGLRRGDIITEIGGEPIKDQFAFAKVMQKQAVGSKVTFKIRRSNAELKLEITIGQG
ncbi:MAG: PDZ domain-containing protein [Fimbriimonadaceae bacterium]|nr:PDZ domain-containing protein [Fimbriimonadaceae bacterium]